MENTNFVGKVGKGYATFRINSLDGLYFVALAEETNSQKGTKMFKPNENEVRNITRNKRVQLFTLTLTLTVYLCEVTFMITDPNPKYLHNSLAPIRIFSYWISYTLY